MAARRAQIKNSHGLVRTPNLDCLVVGHVVLAFGLGAENLCLVDILPGVFATEHIVDFLALEVQLVFEGLFDAEYVRARLAEEAEVAGCLFRE